MANQDLGSQYDVPRRRGLIWLGLLVVLVLLVVSFLLGRASAPQAQLDPGPEVRPGIEIGPGPRELRAGVPVGYSRTREGALQAAINYTRALAPDPGESRNAYAAKLRAIASDEWGDELDSTIASWDESEADVAALRYRVDEFSSNRAEIVLWQVAFVNPRNGAPGGLWARSFLTLQWEEGDWKVAAEDGDAGPWPRPLSGPSNPAELSTQLDGFEPVEYEPASIP